MRLSTEWTRGLKGEDKENFEKLLWTSPVLERLKEILERRYVSVLESELGEDQYDTQSWSHLQAHRNGKRQALKDLLKLVSHLDKDI